MCTGLLFSLFFSFVVVKRIFRPPPPQRKVWCRAADEYGGYPSFHLSSGILKDREIGLFSLVFVFVSLALRVRDPFSGRWPSGVVEIVKDFHFSSFLRRGVRIVADSRHLFPLYQATTLSRDMEWSCPFCLRHLIRPDKKVRLWA